MPSVSEPTTVREAAAVFADASRDGRRVSIGREGGDLVVSTARLDRLLEHAAGDLTATVEAGIRLSALDRHFAQAGQMLALDPPGDPTVGACIAGNLSGPRRHRYGTARDLVLGVTLVLADGTTASSGGKVVKNVAGYDLGKLLCGSGGTLGLIARVSLRLHPRPLAAGTLVRELDGSPEQAWRLFRALQHSTLVPSAVDLLWPDRLAALVEGGERAVEAQLALGQELLGAREADGAVWEEAAERQGAARGRSSFTPGRLADELRRVPAALVRPAPGVAYLPDPVPDSTDEAVRRLTERVRHQFDPQGTLV